MTDLHVSISSGNSKMGAVPSVSLPPIKTCSPMACKFCGKNCYVRRYIGRRKTVREAYERNLKILTENPDQFWREVEGAIKLTTHFRFGVSGDIPNEDYFRHMVDIAHRNSHCEILCFTKQYEICNEYLNSHELPKNLHLTFSAWRGLEMNNPHNLPEAHVFYRNGETTAKDGAKYCSGNCALCSIDNSNCWSLGKGEQIIFKEH